MKKLLCVLLAAAMLAGFSVGAAAEVDPEDSSTWLELVLDQPVDLDFFGYTDSPYPAYMSFYRFTPVESSSYYFEILGPDSLRYRLVYVTTKDSISVWDDSVIYPVAGRIAYLEGGVEYFVVAQAINMMAGSTGTFQLVARKVALKWWQTLSPFLQFLLRWLAFGWIWMR